MKKILRILLIILFLPITIPVGIALVLLFSVLIVFVVITDALFELAFRIKCLFNPEQLNAIDKLDRIVEEEVINLKKTRKITLGNIHKKIFDKQVNIEGREGYMLAYHDNFGRNNFDHITVYYDLRYFNFIKNVRRDRMRGFKLYEDGRIEDFTLEDYGEFD